MCPIWNCSGIQTAVYGERVSTGPIFVPSTLNCTLVTATLSAAMAVSVEVPLIVANGSGVVTETVGGVVSVGRVGVPGAIGVAVTVAEAPLEHHYMWQKLRKYIACH